MTPIRLFAFACLLLASATAGAAEEDAKKDAELKWAKEVASDLLTAGLYGNYVNAEALATSEYRKVLKEAGTSITEGLREVKSGGAESWTITLEEIAPDKDEALFRGAFKAQKEEAAFTLRVAKEKESGKWRVCYFAAGPFKETEKGKK